MAKAAAADIRAAILDLLPDDGSATGNARLREQIAARLGAEVDEGEYFLARDALVADGQVLTGRGRGGSVRRVLDTAPALTLEAQAIPESAKAPKPQQAGLPLPSRKPGEPTKAPRKGEEGAKVIAYQHDQKRRNNPDVGVVTPETDPEQPKTTLTYDPHIDPALQFDSARATVETLIDDALVSGDADTQRAALETLKRMAAPYLNWAGKAERTRFEVDTVSLHVHERIDPASLLAVVRKRMQKDKGEHGGTADMFRAWFEEPLPYREAIEFYKHDRGWANRLVAGDSLLVMNSLLQKEGMAGQVQMIYIDPPYGIKYGSNFQPFVNKRDVKDRKDEDLTQEPEMIKAFRDTWELGIHSYLTYLRDRLLLAKELLHESGSVCVQIGDENVHLARNLLDEIFLPQNCFSQIAVKKTSAQTAVGLSGTLDYVLVYAREISRIKYRQLFREKEVGGFGADKYQYILRDNGSTARATSTDNANDRIFSIDTLVSQRPPGDFPVRFQGQEFKPKTGYWKTGEAGFPRLVKAGRILRGGSVLMYRRFLRDFPAVAYANYWEDTSSGASSTDPKVYVVQTAAKIVERCLLMTTDPGDLVLDPTCGSGTTAFVAEKWGRRWITCDTSRVAVTLAKQRLMTASYDYYELKYPHEGLRGGFIYKTVPHVTLKSIANNPDIDTIFEAMHPAIDAALGKLNAALTSAGAPFKVGEGGRKGQVLDFAKGGALLEWEVPFDFPADWQAGARAAFDAFHAARQAMQQKMDASIAAHAEQETLYDQPTVSKDKLRITGPFTVEAVPFPSVLALETRP
ncbi:MAG: site-specific DNA-methyltransferase, partial [Dokdonella sp.]|nr:site-specific DNA-methyltransferase [Dokdonella sp.]